MTADIRFVAQPPHVEPIAWTVFYQPAAGRYLRRRGVEWNILSSGRESHDELLLEFAGRICYSSWENPGNKTTERYLDEQIVGHDHLSVIEHASISFVVADLPRLVLMELARHRVGTAMSFQSTRFTDANMTLVMPPLIRQSPQRVQTAWAIRARQAVENYHAALSDLGYRENLPRTERKQIIEAARGHLPNEQGTDGVWTCNLRQLRHVMMLRSDLGADASFREFVAQLWPHCLLKFPSVFADLHLYENGVIARRKKNA